MFREHKGDYEDFIKDNFTICPCCGYYNKKEYFNNYGTCLSCGKILNEKKYFIKRLRLELRKTNKRYGVL